MNRESSSSDQIHNSAEIFHHQVSLVHYKVVSLINDKLSFFQESNVPVYYPSPNVRRPLTQLTEEEQVKIAKRIGLIQHLPMGVFDDNTKSREYDQ